VRRKITIAGMLGIVLGIMVLVKDLASREFGAFILLVGILAFLGGVSSFLFAGDRRGTRRHIARLDKKSRRSGGTATIIDHHRQTSAFAMKWRYQGGAVLRPALRELGVIARWRTPLETYATKLGHSGLRRIWISAEDCVIRIAGTRAGKSQAMRVRIRNHIGGVVATSTRVDIIATRGHRTTIGPTHAYDPAGLLKGDAKARWSPLVGCQDPGIAAIRAYDMIPEDGSEEGKRWSIQARRLLRILMHAAAMGNRRMFDAAIWLAADGPAIPGAFEEIREALKDSPVRDEMLHSVKQFYQTADRTRSGIVVAAQPALAWAEIPEARAIGDCTVEESMDLYDIIDRRGTLYILGKKDGTTAPLTGALIGEIIRMAEIEAEQRGGRLDPSLLMSLDEVTKVCTAPVPELSADAGGRGIVLDIATQSIAAIKETWGDNGASMLITNCNAVLVGKGCKDPDDLQRWEDLSGKRWENQETVGKDGETKSITRNRVPVFSQSDIAQLRYRRVIAFGLGPPILIKTPRPKRRHR